MSAETLVLVKGPYQSQCSESPLSFQSVSPSGLLSLLSLSFLIQSCSPLSIGPAQHHTPGTVFTCFTLQPINLLFLPRPHGSCAIPTATAPSQILLVQTFHPRSCERAATAPVTSPALSIARHKIRRSAHARWLCCPESAPLLQRFFRRPSYRLLEGWVTFPDGKTPSVNIGIIYTTVLQRHSCSAIVVLP